LPQRLFVSAQPGVAVAVAAAQLDTTSALAAHLIATVLAALTAALAAAVAHMSRLKVSRCVFRWR
jgi:hypothetical protein